MQISRLCNFGPKGTWNYVGLGHSAIIASGLTSCIRVGDFAPPQYSRYNISQDSLWCPSTGGLDSAHSFHSADPQRTRKWGVCSCDPDIPNMLTDDNEEATNILRARALSRENHRKSRLAAKSEASSLSVHDLDESLVVGSIKLGPQSEKHENTGASAQADVVRQVEVDVKENTLPKAAKVQNSLHVAEKKGAEPVHPVYTLQAASPDMGVTKKVKDDDNQHIFAEKSASALQDSDAQNVAKPAKVVSPEITSTLTKRSPKSSRSSLPQEHPTNVANQPISPSLAKSPLNRYIPLLLIGAPLVLAALAASIYLYCTRPAAIIMKIPTGKRNQHFLPVWAQDVPAFAVNSPGSIPRTRRRSRQGSATHEAEIALLPKPPPTNKVPSPVHV